MTNITATTLVFERTSIPLYFNSGFLGLSQVNKLASIRRHNSVEKPVRGFSAVFFYPLIIEWRYVQCNQGI
jgi:hypothetical protein